MFAPGVIVRWLIKPLDAVPRCIYAVVEEVEAERVIVRFQGPDGDYFRRVDPKKLFVILPEMGIDMKISKTFPSKFVKAADLSGKTVTLAIDKVVLETLGHGQDQERKPVIYFQKATKGMILNAVNARTIAGLYGDETDEWTGKRISIYPDRVKAFGQMHDVIRVRQEIPAQPKPTQPSQPVVEDSEIDDVEDVVDQGYDEHLFDADSEAQS